MEETTKKFPSLPPNYVSLQQLQEQRLREQQQKQKEKEEEEEQQRVKVEKEKKQQQQKEEEEEEEEKKKKLLVSQKAPRIKSCDQTSIRNGRNFSQKSWLIKEKNEAVIVVQNLDQNLEEVEPKRQQKKRNKYKKNGASEIQRVEAEINVGVEAEELPDLDHQNIKEIETKKKKKKQKKKYKGKKPIVEEETLIEDMKESLPPAMIPNENDAGVKKNTRTLFRRRDTKSPPESDQTTAEIVEKIGDLRICDDDEKKSTVEKKKKKKNGDYSGVTRFRKIINGRKRMDGNLMWIRKDEKTDGIPVGSGYIAGKF